jgi:hypothetical protein
MKYIGLNFEVFLAILASCAFVSSSDGVPAAMVVDDGTRVNTRPLSRRQSPSRRAAFAGIRAPAWN